MLLWGNNIWKGMKNGLLLMMEKGVYRPQEGTPSEEITLRFHLCLWLQIIGKCLIFYVCPSVSVTQKKLCVSLCVHVHTLCVQRSTSDVFFNFHLSFGRQNLSMNLELTDPVKLALQWFSGMALSPLPSSLGVSYPSRCQGLALYRQSHLPASNTSKVWSQFCLSLHLTFKGKVIS